MMTKRDLGFAEEHVTGAENYHQIMLDSLLSRWFLRQGFLRTCFKAIIFSYGQKRHFDIKNTHPYCV